YHWLNYFVSTQGEFYRYLRFLTPSFIFITGFVIANVYIVGYGVGDPRVPRRLVRRGFKLLVLFVAIHVIKTWLTPDDILSEVWSLSNVFVVFVTGNVGVDGNSKLTAFNILVPISYVLIASAGLVVLSRWFRYVFHVVCLLCFASIFVLYQNGLASGNLE